jgi:hypothetical protein
MLKAVHNRSFCDGLSQDCSGSFSGRGCCDQVNSLGHGSLVNSFRGLNSLGFLRDVPLICLVRSTLFTIPRVIAQRAKKCFFIGLE